MKTVWNKPTLGQLIAVYDYACKRLHIARNSFTNERAIAFWKSIKMRLECFNTPFYREFLKRGYSMYIVNY